MGCGGPTNATGDTQKKDGEAKMASVVLKYKVTNEKKEVTLVQGIEQEIIAFNSVDAKITLRVVLDPNTKIDPKRIRAKNKDDKGESNIPREAGDDMTEILKSCSICKGTNKEIEICIEDYYEIYVVRCMACKINFKFESKKDKPAAKK